jgi:hypothetical protein
MLGVFAPDLRRTRLTWGEATLLSGHAGDPRAAASDRTRSSQALGPTSSIWVSSPSSENQPARSDATVPVRRTVTVIAQYRPITRPRSSTVGAGTGNRQHTFRPMPNSGSTERQKRQPGGGEGRARNVERNYLCASVASKPPKAVLQAKTWRQKGRRDQPCRWPCTVEAEAAAADLVRRAELARAGKQSSARMLALNFHS